MDVSILLILVSLMGASGDLLDYIPSPVYWQSKQVQITPAAMAAELADPKAPDVSGLIDQLSSADPQARADAKTKLAAMGPKIIGSLRAAADSGDPETAGASRELIATINAAAKPLAVRRLMAIRALGELGDSSALPILKPLLKSPEMFEADYAAAAIAAIAHRPATRPVASDADRAADAWNLPPDIAAVGQAVCRGTHPFPLETVLSQMAPANGGADQQLGPIYGAVMMLADMVGNMRLQNITLGFSDQSPLREGYGVIVLRGQYDSRAVAAALKEQRLPSQSVGGLDYYQSYIVGIFMPGDDRFVVVFGRQAASPLPIVTAVTTGKRNLRDSPAMAALLTAADKTQPAWGVLGVTPAFRNTFAMLAPFDSVVLNSRFDGKALHLAVSAKGTDPAAAQADVAQLNVRLAAFVTRVRPAIANVPFGRVGLAALDSIHCQADGPGASLTMDMPSPADTIPATPTTQPR